MIACVGMAVGTFAGSGPDLAVAATSVAALLCLLAWLVPALTVDASIVSPALMSRADAARSSIPRQFDACGPGRIWPRAPGRVV